MPEIVGGVPFSIWDGEFPPADTVGGVALVVGNVVFRSDTGIFYRFDGPATYTQVAP